MALSLIDDPDRQMQMPLPMPMPMPMPMPIKAAEAYARQLMAWSREPAPAQLLVVPDVPYGPHRLHCYETPHEGQRMKEIVDTGLPPLQQPFSWAVKASGTMLFTSVGCSRDETGDSGLRYVGTGHFCVD